MSYQTYRCGCVITQKGVAYCGDHFWMKCHVPWAPNAMDGECPNCWRLRLASVNFTKSAIPTRHA